MTTPIKQITIEGFKSIQKLENFTLRNLNVLIGANGAGKSNFVEFFTFIRVIAEGNLQTYVAKAGGGDGFFFGGPKTTSKIDLRYTFDDFVHELTLEPTADGKIVISKKTIWLPDRAQFRARAAGRSESAIDGDPSRWTVYHFHDTSSLSPMRREQSIEDTAYLRPDASNIAAFLRVIREQHKPEFSLIRDTVRLVAPFLDDFILKERINGSERKVALDWRQRGSDFPFQPWQLSDGTIRFICLATALLQPNPPPTIVIDEPELGLHPHALEMLAGLMQKASQQVQVIISTQSAPLLSQFEPEDVITVCRRDGASTFNRLNEQELTDWLKDYTLGELWQKNVVEAGAGND